MRRWAAMILAVVVIAACTTLIPPRSVGEIQESQGLTCLEYQEGIAWQQVADKFGEPDIAPKPGPGDLSKNTRIYKGMTAILYTKREQIREGDRLRFVEVVYKVELCK